MMLLCASSGMKLRSRGLGVGSLRMARAAMSSGVSQVGSCSAGGRARIRPVIMRVRRMRFGMNILFAWLVVVVVLFICLR